MTTVPEEAVKAETLWAVNIHGPDDLIAAPDYMSAVRMANAFNAWWLDLKTKHPHNDAIDARIWAVPTDWEGNDARGHADELSKPHPEYQWLRDALSALEPSAARKLALVEEFATIRAVIYCYEGDSAQAFEAQKALAKIESAIRALGTSCEQLNKAVSNVPDQQENEPGAHGERERVLEEAARSLIAVRYHTYKARNGKLCSIEGDDGEKAWIVPFDAMADLESALSSQDHADAGKVEGDGRADLERFWRSISEADKSITFEQTFDTGDGKSMTIRNSDHYWVRDADGRVYEATWSDHKGGYWWDLDGESPVDPVEYMPHPLSLRSAPSQEVAGS